jgi:hypothetical protein
MSSIDTKNSTMNPVENKSVNISNNNNGNNGNGKKYSLFENLKHPELLYNLINWIFNKKGRAKEFTVEFKKLFYDKEIGELYGYKNGNFWKIVMLYLTLFISVGFGIQSKNYFNKQLDNPFVRFLSVPIVGEAKTVQGFLDTIQQNYQDPAIRRKFHLDTIRSISIKNSPDFVSDYIQLTFDGMADDHNSSMISEAICGEDNNYIGTPYSSIEDRTVIVTLDMLKDLYLVPDSVLITEIDIKDLPGYVLLKPPRKDFAVPLLIQGVAEQLPYGHNFLLTTKFNDFLFGNDNLIYCDSTENQISFYVDTVLEQEHLKSVLLPIAEKHGIQTDGYNFEISVVSGIHPMTLVCFNNVNEKNISYREIKKAVIEEYKLKPEKIIDAYFKEYDYIGADYAVTESFNASDTKNSLLIIFNDLKKVKDFNDELKTFSSQVITRNINIGSTKQRKGIEMDMENVNMRFILNIIEIIVTSFLFIIGILAVTSLISFIRVLFEKYFQKIEKNIGTFMAFGINIKVVYSIMLTIFVIITLSVSIILALLGGYIAEFFMIKIIGNSAQEGLRLFSLFNWWTIIALLAVIGANVIAFKQASKIFSKWPGDIINDR